LQRGRTADGSQRKDPEHRDGSVEALVEGEKKSIDEWIEEIWTPRYAEVTKIDSNRKSSRASGPTST
jgi:acylphosphatase